MGILRDFLRSVEGYVTALALIAMPLLLGFALLVIDVGRANNLHTDLQNATDSLALAGARELDGGSNSITRANDALAALVKNEARFGNGGPAIIDNTQVSAIYLDAIPPSDDTRIDAAWVTAHQTTDGLKAVYLLVRSTPRAMTTLFPLPVGLTLQTLNIQAEAVAVYDASACDVTPLFICNPFEPVGGSGNNLTFQENFAQGATYGRQLILSFSGNSSPQPGNFGWLEVAASGGNALRDALATGKPGLCYGMRGLQTKTGGTIGPAEQGINTRFGVYAGAMKNNDPDTAPAYNVRRGEKDPTKTSSCSAYTEETDRTKAMALPDWSLPGGTYSDQTLVGGGVLKGDKWDYSAYWTLNHPGASAPSTFPKPTDPTGSKTIPSRYDVYSYENKNDLVTGAANKAPNGETGEGASNRCYKGSGTISKTALDRRMVFAAVINCHQDLGNGHATITKPKAFVSLFLTKPMITNSTTKTLSAEIVDVSGYNGNGTLDTFLREESYLVR
ncbi:Tad domain-containing protein [Mesorhizobium sp. WSM3626]|uniref:TadE/TadG family type IV pilus assembly protein n=1 Tax=Mesorhizobium sp. WSM3626 TaxID=1040987 RepID=UPI0005182D62|nr:Tad domain-containing protein [Mesorhizobium sp. WSM3626]